MAGGNMAVYTRITGTGSFFPEKVMTNKDFESFLDTSDEWIVSRTGIKERHIAEHETCSTMGAEAAKNALDMAGRKAEDMDGIICATFTPDTTMPTTACRIQQILGISGPFAFDAAAACSGFIYSLMLADSLIRAGNYKKLLVVGSEKLTSTVDFTDRGTCILFGDGAGAFVLEADTEPGIRSVHAHAAGEYGHLLTVESLGTEFLKHRNERNIEDGLLHMSGNEIFKIAVRNMADAAVKAVETSGFGFDEIDYLVPHQANLRIIDATAKRLKIPKEKVVINLDKYGNTSSATIPTAFDGAVRDGRIKRGSNVVCAAFGGGLTWGSLSCTF